MRPPLKSVSNVSIYPCTLYVISIVSMLFVFGTGCTKRYIGHQLPSHYSINQVLFLSLFELGVANVMSDAVAYGPWQRVGDCTRPSEGECSADYTCCGQLVGVMHFRRTCEATNGCADETLEKRSRCNVRCGQGKWLTSICFSGNY